MDSSIQHPPVIGVLLAAGSGSRLGLGPKALLRKAQGPTLLECATYALLEGGCTEVVVVLGAQAARVREQVPHRATTVLVNAAWATGMGSSFALGMGQVPEGCAALVALVDQPGVDAELIRRVIGSHRPGRITAAAYRRGNAPLRRGHPVLFAPDHLGPASLAAAGDAGARTYLATHREVVDLVDCSDLDSGLDIDVVDDLHLLRGK